MNRKPYTPMQSYMIRRFHPRRILIDMAALPWSVYFLWQHDWIAALVVAVAGAALGALATRNVNPEWYGRTLMGRLAFLHLEPFNVAVQLAGIVAMIWAIWAHSGTGILGALSVIYLGHLAGWDTFLAETGAGASTRAA